MAALTSTFSTPQDKYVASVLEAIVRNAVFTANLVADFLDQFMGLPRAAKRQKPVTLPSELLLELGAALRLCLWEETQIRKHLPDDLPDGHKVLSELTRMLSTGESPPGMASKMSLGRRVFEIWLSRMAWDGTRYLGADLLLTAPDDDEFAIAMADFLWKHRHLNVNEANHEA